MFAGTVDEGAYAAQIGIPTAAARIIRVTDDVSVLRALAA